MADASIVCVNHYLQPLHCPKKHGGPNGASLQHRIHQNSTSQPIPFQGLKHQKTTSPPHFFVPPKKPWKNDSDEITFPNVAPGDHRISPVAANKVIPQIPNQPSCEARSKTTEYNILAIPQVAEIGYMDKWPKGEKIRTTLRDQQT